MTQINMDGIVGLEVYATDIRQALAAADGDVEIIINSPGGSVTEGIAIYNAIRDHSRAGYTVKARVVGLAASMATYIPMAADVIEVEDNAVFMIHNPYMLAMGDYRDMAKAGGTLEALASMLATAYSRKTDKEKDEIRALMDNETYLFGQEIIDAGFADAMTPAGEGPETADEAVALAQQRVTESVDKLSSKPENTEQVAAMLPDYTAENPAQPEKILLSRSQAGKREVPMQEQQKGNPVDTVRSYDEGIQAGVEQERARVLALTEQKSYDPDNGKLAEVIEAAIRDGKALAEVQTAINVAIRDGSQFAGENAPNVGSMPEKTEKPYTDEEQSVAKALGITVEQLRAQGDE